MNTNVPTRRRAWLLLAVSASFLGSLAAAELRWLDGEAALAEARASDRDAVLLFTGSDWCSWCHKLDEGALRSPEFASAVSERFVFGVVDILKRSEQPADVVARNEALVKRYEITGYPTIVLCDPAGVAYGRAGYKRLDGAAYAAHLLTIQRGKDLLAQLETAAEQATGTALARALKAIIDHRELMGMPVPRDLPLRASAADADGSVGLREPYRLRILESDAQEAITAALRAKDVDNALQLVDAALADQGLTPEIRQRLMHRKAGVLLHRPPPVDKALVLRVLDEALALAPGSEGAAGIEMLRQAMLHLK